MLGVAVSSVSKWIDAGKLPAGKTPGGHRRIPREEFCKFLRRQKLPIPPELQEAGSMSILLVDDEKAFTFLLSEQIKSQFPYLEVFEANDAYAAGEMAATAQPSLIVLYLSMPGMDSFEICRRIKSSSATAPVEVVAFTSHSSPKIEKRIMAAGASACIKKGDIAALMLLIAKHFKPHH